MGYYLRDAHHSEKDFDAMLEDIRRATHKQSRSEVLRDLIIDAHELLGIDLQGIIKQHKKLRPELYD